MVVVCEGKLIAVVFAARVLQERMDVELTTTGVGLEERDKIRDRKRAAVVGHVMVVDIEN